MTSYFSDHGLQFLRMLADNNDRAWFHAHKQDYQTHVRAPFQRLLSDLQAPLRQASEHYLSDPKAVGGSLFRIHRDTRYSADKAPYKPWQGARLYHRRRRQTPAPAYYLHLQPGHSFIGAGLWHPEPETLRKLRQFIVDNPVAWQAAAHAPPLRRRYSFDDDEKLRRPPRGFDPQFAFIDDLRQRNFIAYRRLDDAMMTGPRLLPSVSRDLRTLAPWMDYLCAALELEF